MGGHQIFCPNYLFPPENYNETCFRNEFVSTNFFIVMTRIGSSAQKSRPVARFLGKVSDLYWDSCASAVGASVQKEGLGVLPPKKFRFTR